MALLILDFTDTYFLEPLHVIFRVYYKNRSLTKRRIAVERKLVISAKQDDVEKEACFQTLNEKGFVRADSPEHQWYLLLNEACASSGVYVDNVVKDYLATMLNRFVGRVDLFEQLSAFDFYRHVLGLTRVDSVCVQDIADISLQYVAFFPERSCNRHEPRSLEYVANVGTSLYRGLAKSSEGKDDWFSGAFKLMAKSFGSAVIVLRSACPRFIQQQKVLREKLHSEEVFNFPTFPEMAKLAPAIRNFDHMYLNEVKALVT